MKIPFSSSTEAYFKSHSYNCTWLVRVGLKMNKCTAVASEPMAIQPAKMWGVSGYIISCLPSHLRFLRRKQPSVTLWSPPLPSGWPPEEPNSSSLKQTWKPETMRNSEKNSTGHRLTKKPGRPPIMRGFPQWHHATTSAAGDFQETRGNMRKRKDLWQINWKQVDRNKSLFLLNWLIDLYAEKTAKSLLVIFLS